MIKGKNLFLGRKLFPFREDTPFVGLNIQKVHDNEDDEFNKVSTQAVHLHQNDQQTKSQKLFPL